MFSLFKSITDFTKQAFKKTPQNLTEMLESQETRYSSFKNYLLHFGQKEDKRDLDARKQYWCAQTYFFLNFLNKNMSAMCSIINSNVKIPLDDPDAVSSFLTQLMLAIDDPEKAKQFVSLIAEDGLPNTHRPNKMLTPSQELDSTQPQQSLYLHHGDIIRLIDDLLQQNILPIVDNAANSNRDGCTKYAEGSLEELLARFTDSAWKMVLHFDNVHERSFSAQQYAFSEKPPLINILDYQKRYLQLLLNIIMNMINLSEKYLESKSFLNDLFMLFDKNEFKDGELQDRLPIYFGMQNNVYEVPPTDGFISHGWFADTSNLLTTNEVFETFNRNLLLSNLSVVSYAAPDQRGGFKPAMLDRMSTSNVILQNPSQALRDMIQGGVSYHCKQAIALAQTYNKKNISQPIAIVFIMPGCGAFDNPPKETAELFISTIGAYIPDLQKRNISCHIIEYNKSLFNTIVNTCKSLIPNVPTTIFSQTQPSNAEAHQSSMALKS